MIRTIAKNTVLLSASQLIARSLGFLYFIFLSRALGVANFGVYAFIISFVYNFMPVADFGLERLVLKDVSRDLKKTSYYFSRLFPLRFFLGLAAYVLTLVLGIVSGKSLQEFFYLAIFGACLIPYNLIYLVASFQNAREKMEVMAFANIALIVLSSILGIAFISNGLSLGWIFAAYPISTLVVTILFIFCLRSWNLSIAWVIDFTFWKKVIRQSWVFATLTILAVFYLRLSIILVGLIKSDYLTGLYGSGFKFVDALISIPQSLALALFPISSRLFLADKEKLRIIYKRGLAVLFLISLPFVLALTIFPKIIIFFAYGKDYLPSITIYPVFGLALILFFLNTLPGNIIQNSPKVKNFLPFAFFNFLIALILCLILIPRYSIIGAAWAVVGGELAGLVINNLFVWKILRE